MGDNKESNRWSASDIAIFAGLGAFLGVGLYLRYRTFVILGGFSGMVTFGGRLLLEMLLVFAAFVAYLVVFAIVHVVASLLTGTKLRRVKVFISFKHDYEALVTELEKGMVDRDIEVIRLTFRERDHDNVILESLEAVRTADAVVVVPGPEPSWMANELSVAVDRKKPIAVIKHLSEQRLSDSLYRGYPVFTWAKLDTDGFAALRRFLRFVTRSRGDLWPQFQRSLAGLGELVIKGLLAWWFVYFIIREIIEILAAFAPHRAEAIWVGWLGITFVLLAVSFGFSFGKAVLRRVQGIKVARQKMLTREATLGEFSEVFSSLEADATILDILESVPLKPRHEENLTITGQEVTRP